MRKVWTESHKFYGDGLSQKVYTEYHTLKGLFIPSAMDRLSQLKFQLLTILNSKDIKSLC